MTFIEILKDLIFPLIIAVIIFFVGRYSTKIDKKKDKLRAKNNQLKTENSALKEQLALYEDVEPSTTGNYLIMKKNGWKICPTCWAKDHKPIPIYDNGGGTFVCGGCGKAGTYDHQKVRERGQRIEAQNKRTAEYFNF